MSDRKLATMMLNAVWNEDVRGLRRVLRMGADPNWIFNGYPILIHAVFTRNEKIMMLLIKAGAVQVEEALGFALDRCVGEMIFPLAFLGGVGLYHASAGILPEPVSIRNALFSAGGFLAGVFLFSPLL